VERKGVPYMTTRARLEETEDLRFGECMKPVVNRVAGVPMTALLCCPQCYRLISYDRDQGLVHCHVCGTTVRGKDLPQSLGSSATRH